MRKDHDWTAPAYPIGEDEEGNLIWLITGADDDPDDSDDDADEDSEDADEEDEDEDSEDADDKKHPKSAKKAAPPAKKAAPKKSTTSGTWTPPSKAEWERTQAALQKLSTKEKAARTAQLEKARKEGMDEAAQKARDEANKEKDDFYVPQILKLHAKDALRDAECKNAKRAVNLLDLSKVDFNGGDPIGLEAEINRLKEEWPELFKQDEDETPAGTKKPAKKAAPAAKVGAADKKDDDKGKPPTGATQIAKRLLGSKA